MNTKPNPQLMLAVNISRLLASHKDINNQTKLAKKSGISQPTISRILSQELVASIDTVQRLANAFGLAAWQLLVDNLDPDNPPMLRELSEEDRENAKRLIWALRAFGAEGVHQ